MNVKSTKVVALVHVLTHMEGMWRVELVYFKSVSFPIKSMHVAC